MVIISVNIRTGNSVSFWSNSIGSNTPYIFSFPEESSHNFKFTFWMTSPMKLRWSSPSKSL